jgi:hypothetical protein
MVLPRAVEPEPMIASALGLDILRDMDVSQSAGDSSVFRLPMRYEESQRADSNQLTAHYSEQLNMVFKHISLSLVT